MNRDAVRAKIRAQIKCTDYLKKSKYGMYCCPYCGSGEGSHGTGAVKYYPETNTACCFAGCSTDGKGKVYDVIDLHMQKYGMNYDEALHDMADRIGETIDPYRPDGRPSERRTALPKSGVDTKAPAADKTSSEAAETPTDKADYTAYYKACMERINDPAAVAYLQGRGISPETAARYWVGYDPAADPAGAPGAMGNTYRPHPCPRIVIPTGKAHYVGRRSDGGEDFEKINSKGGSPGIFNAGALYAQDVREIFVVEGAFDALSILEAGYQAIALNSAGNFYALIKRLEQKKTAATLILCPDNDKNPKTAEAVKKHFDSLAAGLQRLNVPFVTVNICGDCKDANEALQADKETFAARVAEIAGEAAQMASTAPEEAPDDSKRKALEDIGRLLDELKGADSFSEYVAAERQAHSIISKIFSANPLHEQKDESRRGCLVYEDVVKEFQAADDEIITIKSFPNFSKAAKIKKHSTIAIAADTGGGKSSLAINFLNDLSENYPCIYFNLEMDKLTFLRRLVSIQSGIELDRIEGYKNDKQTAEAVNAYIKVITERQPIQVIQDVYLLNEIEDIIRAATAKREQPTMVFIDHSLLVELSGHTTGRYERFTIISEQLRKIALRYNAVIFVLLQQNRAGKSEDEERPKNSSLKESGSWENDATQICFLWYDTSIRRKKLLLTKNRGGEQGEFNLEYWSKTQTYKEAKAQDAGKSPTFNGSTDITKPSKRDKAREKLQACYEAAAVTTNGKPTLRAMAEAADVTTATVKGWIKEYGGCIVDGQEVDPAGLDTSVEYTGFIKLTPVDETPFNAATGATPKAGRRL